MPKVSEVDRVINELETQMAMCKAMLDVLKAARADAKVKKPATAPKRAKLKKVEKPSEAAS